MFQSIVRQVEKISAFIGDHPFSSGFLTGLVTALALALLVVLLDLIFRRHRLRFIVIRMASGELRIDARAVQGAVLAVAKSFPAFTVRKVSLGGKQTAVKLFIAMDFNGGTSLSELSERFRAAVAQMTTDVLGMEKPARIELEILRSDDASDGEKDSDESSASKSEPGKSC